MSRRPRALLSRSGGLTCTPLILPAWSYLIVFLSPVPSHSQPLASFSYSLSLAFNPFLILYFILLLQSFQVPRRIHTIIDINLSASLLLFSPSNFVIREEIFHAIFFIFLPVKTSTRESWYFSFSFVSTNNPRLI